MHTMHVRMSAVAATERISITTIQNLMECTNVN